MTISLIVAVARNGVIGKAGTMPWHLPADLQHFKRLTMGKPMVMGRRTYESIGKPLPGRTNIVLTRDRGWRRPGCTAVQTIEEALAAAARAATPGANEVMIIGGGSVYAAFLPRAARIYLTRIEADVAGDTHFPDLDPTQWEEAGRTEHVADGRNPYPYTFLTLERRR